MAAMTSAWLAAGACVCESGWIHDLVTGRCSTSVCSSSTMFCMNDGVCTDGSDECDCADWYNYNEWNSAVDVHCEHCECMYCTREIL